MAVYPQIVINDAVYLQAESFSAQDDRRQMQDDPMGPGVLDRNAFNITLVSGRTVRAAPGVAYIKGRNVADQGFYRQFETANRDVTHNAGDGSNPRIDQVIIRVMDNAHDAAGFNETRIEAVPGTPTGGATLDNRSGALNLDALGEASKNYLLLADVLVPTGATTINASDIRDRRCFATLGTIPPLLTDVDIVSMIPHPSLSLAGLGTPASGYAHASHDLNQVAALYYLPRRITSATRIRWKYAQLATAAVGNWNIGIYDASGRKIIETGAIAFAGAANSFQVISATITATSFDAGWYYVVWGADTSAGGFSAPGVIVRNIVTDFFVGAPAPNMALHSLTGGTTLPNTILGYTDCNGMTAADNLPEVPHVALSVG